MFSSTRWQLNNKRLNASWKKVGIVGKKTMLVTLLSMPRF
jgi:hypothetical protein